jgi:hypothetical protein
MTKGMLLALFIYMEIEKKIVRNKHSSFFVTVLLTKNNECITLELG